MASGALDRPGGTEAMELFNVVAALPQGFNTRIAVDPILKVAPLPPQPQTVSSGSRQGQKRKSEIDTLLSQDHLEHIYSHHLGSKRQDDNHDPKHPLWGVADDILRSMSDTKSIADSPDGISATVNACLRELASNIDNLWSSTIFEKALDYLLRILLRLHLAPERERRYWEGRRDAAVKKKSMALPVTPKPAKKSKSKIKQLCDDLKGNVDQDGR